jgi:excinuclease ABC subunit C
MNYIKPILPKLPGVYLFKNSRGEIVYIGKAVNLQERVGTYFANYKTDWKIKALLDEYTTVDYIVTATEHDALILEAQLVQEHQPKFNRLLKEGNPFLYIRYTEKPVPTFSIVRTKKGQGIHLGPFINKIDARKTMHFMLHTFRLYRCNRTMANGCLQYHIGLCAGNCRADFDEFAYRTRAQLALHALCNERDAFLLYTKKAMQQAIAEFKFERAKHLHEYMQHIDVIFATLAKRTSWDAYIAEVTTVTVPLPVSTEDAIQTARALQTYVGGTKPISTIDCFDISHFQSRSMVGSCVRFTHGMPDKKAFRRFAIRSLETQNDYAALQEIIKRRYKAPDDIPDLVLIDGGIGQLHAAQMVLPNTLVAALAKREERLFCNAHPHGIILDPHDTVAKILLSLRDYTHHFAITYHRLKQRIQSKR